MVSRYILTNRHVVGAGPFWGYCIFDNHEEVDAYPVYRDPIHDFGILRFDPKAIKYMKIDNLLLRPDLAKGMWNVSSAQGQCADGSQSASRSEWSATMPERS